MITLRDGPAAGSFAVRTAPMYLRAVVSDKGNDVLNLPADTPRPDETVYVYRRVTPVSHVHINMRSKGSGFYAMAEYEHMPMVNGESFRSRGAWTPWVELHADADE